VESVLDYAISSGQEVGFDANQCRWINELKYGIYHVDVIAIGGFVPVEYVYELYFAIIGIVDPVAAKPREVIASERVVQHVELMLR
jgi:hypothetical protein